VRIATQGLGGDCSQVKDDIHSFGPSALQVHEYRFTIKVAGAIGWQNISNPLLEEEST